MRTSLRATVICVVEHSFAARRWETPEIKSMKIGWCKSGRFWPSSREPDVCENWDLQDLQRNLWRFSVGVFFR